MRLRFLTTFAVAALATLSASACSNESPSAPPNVAAPAAASQSLLGLGSTSTHTVIPLLRSTPLPADITVSQTIGALGGTISIPAAGLTLVVPPLAMSKSTSFVITARKGSYIAYDMEPHGTQFLVPLVATQSLANTNVRSLVNVSLWVGYYPDPTHITTVTDLLSVQVDLLKLTAVSTIPHFSGYIWASGLEDQ
jgi:hypothetical protein